MFGVRRVITGVSGSPGSLRALRFAADVARVGGVALVPVLAWVPPADLAADARGLRGWALRHRSLTAEVARLPAGESR